jgi:hypothetical protein
MSCNLISEFEFIRERIVMKMREYLMPIFHSFIIQIINDKIIRSLKPVDSTVSRQDFFSLSFFFVVFNLEVNTPSLIFFSFILIIGNLAIRSRVNESHAGY